MTKKAFSLFCDDIRQEMTGKFILIGCYGDTMQVKNFPISLNLALFVTYTCKGGVKQFNGRLKLESGASVSSAKIEVQETPYKEDEIAHAQIPVTGMKVTLSREDELIFLFGADDEELIEIGRLKVELDDAI